MHKPKIIATAHFTKDMVDALQSYFEDYEMDGIVKIEITDHGLWWQNPDGTRQFLGSTKPFPRGTPEKVN